MRRRTGELAPAAVLVLLANVALLAPAPGRAAAAGLELTARADRTEMAEDEALVLEIRVEAEAGSPSIDLHEAELPFRVLSRSWSTDATADLGGGGGVRIRRTRVLRLSLSPRRRGELVIPPIVATVKGVRRRTEPIRVRVSAAGSGPRAPGPVPDRSGGTWRGWERDLALDVEVDRREAFVGEQVTATVWLLSPLGVVDTESYQPPLYDGFWVEEIDRPQRLTFQVRNVRGVPTRAYALQRLALFPTRAGTIELGPFRIEVLLRLGGDPSPLGDLRRASRRSAPVRLRVKPLPPGAPVGFQGVNVGAWKLDATLAEGTAAVGQPVAVHVTAAGDGNVRALSLPRLPAVTGARAFEPTASEDVQRKGTRLGGSRTLETVLVPESPGELVVPALAWPYFDPGSGRYVTAHTRELRIAVTPGDAVTARVRSIGSPVEELRPIRTGGALEVRGPPPWRRLPFLAAVVLPPIGLAALVLADAWRRRSARDAPGRRARGAGRLAAKRLRASRKRLLRADPEGALAGVVRALMGYAGDRLGLGAAGMARGELGAALRAEGAREVGTLALAAALDACDAARFGGGTPPEDVLALAERALALLEAAPWRAPRRGA